MNRNCIYKFINNNDEIIYIGKAEILENRINKKGHKSRHLPQECYDEIAVIQYTSFSTENDMDFAERYYIKKYKPKYNDKHAGKPITMDLEELDNKIWTTYYLDENEVIKQIDDFLNSNYTIKADINILDFYLMVISMKHEQFNNYEIYKEFERKNQIEQLKYFGYEDLEKQYKYINEIDNLDKLINIKLNIKNYIKKELDSIFDRYKLLKYNFWYDSNKCYTKGENNNYYIDVSKLSETINISERYFEINLNSYSKYEYNNSLYNFRYKMIVECN